MLVLEWFGEEEKHWLHLFIYFLSLSQEFFGLTRSPELLPLELRCLRVMLEYAVYRELEVSPELLKERVFSDLL